MLTDVTENLLRKPVVFLAHPRGQHSTRLAAALVKVGMLSIFATGGGPSRVPLGGVEVRRPRWLGLLLRLPQRVIPASMRKYWNHLLWWRFSRRVAPWATSSDVVIAFENAALDVFKASRQSRPSALRVLECPAVHYTSQSYGRLTHVGRYFVKLINRRKDFEIHLAEVVVVLSQYAKSTFIRAGVPADKIRVLPLGVDTTFFTTQPLPDAEQPFRFLFVGGATHWKGVDVLARAFSAIPGGAVLRFVGISTPYLRRSITGIANIEVRNPVNTEGLLHEYANCHVLVLPSRFDGFGMVVTEAMACGRPVIVSDHVGAADVIITSGPERCGWIVPADDEAALLSAMNNAMSRRAELHVLAEAARHRAEQFSWQRYEEDVARLYENLTEQASND